jgi:AAA+ superfamily predicted ATPase
MVMRVRIERKPTYPTGASFGSSGVVELCTYSTTAHECYHVRIGKNKAIGIIIRSGSNVEGERMQWRQVQWWKARGGDVLTLTDTTFENQSEGTAFSALLELRDANARLDLNDVEPLTQTDATSTLREMIRVCQSGEIRGLWPIFDTGSVLLVRKPSAYYTFPIFLAEETDAITQESLCVQSIAQFAYNLVTGVDLRQGAPLETHRLATPLRQARLWNKNIEESLSLLLNRILDTTQPHRVETLSDLARAIGIEPSVVSIRQEPPKKEEMKSGLQGLAKVAGMLQLKSLLIEEVVSPFRDPEPYKRFGISIPNGLLLYGPPGCGKTFIAKQLAEELGFNFFELIPSQVASPFIHDTVLKISDIFARAEELAPSIVFIDEFEALVPARTDLGGHQQYKSEEVNELLIHLNESAQKQVLVMAATNEPGKIDNAVLRPGRLDKLIYVGPPDLEARMDLLRMYLSNRPVAKVDLNYLAELLAGYSCSDIRNVVDDAARAALRDNKQEIDIGHLADSIRRNPSSLTEDMLGKYSEFRQRGI